MGHDRELAITREEQDGWSAEPHYCLVGGREFHTGEIAP
jgi:hypothetical protein